MLGGEGRGVLALLYDVCVSPYTPTFFLPQQSCTELGWRNTWESDSWRPHHSQVRATEAEKLFTVNALSVNNCCQKQGLKEMSRFPRGISSKGD